MANGVSDEEVRHKVVSVSRKKLRVYEGNYIKTNVDDILHKCDQPFQPLSSVIVLRNTMEGANALLARNATHVRPLNARVV